MKKILFGAVAAMIALAACETIQPVEEPLERPQENVSAGRPSEAGSVSDSVLFTASLGVQSKTYLEYDGYKYKTLWDATDNILVWDADCFATDNYDGFYESCNLKSGAGTTQATFAGTLDADSYVALYAYEYYYPYNGYPAINLPAYQGTTYVNGETNISPYFWPMIAVSDTKDFEFQNLCSILKVSLTGDGENLSAIHVTSKGNETLAGDFYINDAYELVPYVNASTSLAYSCNFILSSEPVDCYIVVPAQYYSQGLSFTVLTDRGNMEVSTGELTTERSRFYDVPIEVEPVPMPDGVYLEPRYAYSLTPSNAEKFAMVETTPGVFGKFLSLESSQTEVYSIVKWEDGVRTVYAGYDYGTVGYGEHGYSYKWFSVVPFNESQWYIYTDEHTLYYVHLDFNNYLVELLPAKWSVRGTHNNWDVTTMDIETSDFSHYTFAARDLVFNTMPPMFKFDYSWEWYFNEVCTNLGEGESGLVFDGADIQLGASGVYDIELYWTLTGGDLLDGFSYNVTRVGDADFLDYSYCQLELVGPSVASGETETIWNWGNALLASNGGYPSCEGSVYTWTWSVYLENEEDTRLSFPDPEPGFKLRTLDYAESGGIPAFDCGYSWVDQSLSAVVDAYGTNILVEVTRWYDVSFSIDARTGYFTFVIK